MGAFHKIYSLTSAVLNDGLETLGTGERYLDGKLMYGVFEDSGIKRVHLPSSLRVIQYSAFEECQRLGSIKLPEGLREICMRCFFNSGLESVEIPESVKSIGGGAFYSCKRLRNAHLNEGLEALGKSDRATERNYVGSVFAESALESIVVPSTVKTIQCATFIHCKSLRAVQLQEGLEEICFDAFQESGLESVALPASLRAVFQGAFSSCEKLKEVRFSSGLEVLGSR